MRAWMFAGALALAGVAFPGFAQRAPTAEESAKLRQAGAEVLFWSQEQRLKNFPAMEKIFPGQVVKAGTPRPLAEGKPLTVPEGEIEAFMSAQNVAGLIVLQDGKVRLERYAFGYGPEGRWTSFSVAKSFTSTLAGAAVRDGYIKSLDDPVTRYIPDLKGSAYDGVSVAQLLTMTSGVKWNEDYTDPDSDVAKMLTVPVPAGAEPPVAYMRTLPREAPAGSKWVYKTGETNLIGVLVAKATNRPLAAYLSEKIWKPYGMQADAFWQTDQSGAEIGGCCMSISLRDYARMGQFVLEGGKGVVPEGWFAQAAAAQAQIGRPGYGYGYQWWTYPQGRFGAQGIFGQSVLIDPARKLVIAMSSAWPRATDPALSAQRAAFQARLIAAAD